MTELGYHPLAQYYMALDLGNYEDCAALFAKDAVYIRPTRLAVDSLEVLQGRGEIREFLRRRGKQPFHHRILAAAIDGDSCFVEGRVGGAGLKAHGFMAHGTVGADGLIQRYVAFLSLIDPAAVLDRSIGFDDEAFTR